MKGFEQYLERRSWLSNEGTQFSCPDSCPRYGCKDPGLHVPVTLMDLVLESTVLKARPSEIYDRFYKVGWSPEDEMTWVGSLTLELKKPCGFLEGPWCGIYPARPIGCAQFPEAWYLWRRAKSTLPHRARFQRYPCLKRPPAISTERGKHLADLSWMAAQERWVSDIYLFGISPFYVDLRNLVGEVTEVAQDLGLLKKRTNPVTPRVIPYPLIESFIQGKLEETGVSKKVLKKVARLDSREETRSFFALKEASDKIHESPGLKEIVIYYRFEGQALQMYREMRRRTSQGEYSAFSLEGESNGYSGEKERTSFQCPSSGPFYQKRSQEGCKISEYRPGRDQD